ncbi:creatininase family protein [candidate division WOR-3 bacterium]|nr:creatininase family protein [candidate division WOR-3 bacterium]
MMKESSIDTVILPVGTIEAHGIAPLGTDVIIPEKLSEDIAENINALVAPSVSYGLTGSLMPYRGSMTLMRETFENLLYEISLSLSKTGFKKLIINNGHGGNISSVKNAASRIYSQTGLFVISIHWWINCGDLSEHIFGKTGGHGAVDETAMIQHIMPDLVKWDYLSGVPKYRPSKGIESIPSPSTIIVYDENGGIPQNNPELSSKFYSSVKNRLIETLEEMFDDLNKWISSDQLS